MALSTPNSDVRGISYFMVPAGGDCDRDRDRDGEG